MKALTEIYKETNRAMGYSELHEDQHTLLRLRKIQYLTSSFSTTMLKRDRYSVLQLFLVILALCSLVVYRYYALERYHLYGCREHYKRGFPLRCPPHMRPSGLDDDSIFLLMLGIGASLCTVALPPLFAALKWKHHLGKDIQATAHHYLEMKGIDARCAKLLVNLLFHLEGLPAPDHTENQPVFNSGERFLRHLNSCIWTEMYLALHFRQHKLLALLLAGLVVSTLLPSLIFAWDNKWHGGVLFLCAVLFHVFPVFASVTISVCLLLVAHEVFLIPLIVTTTCSLGFWFLFLAFLYKQERSREISLSRKAYSECLTREKGITVRDLDICLEMRGYRGHIDVKMSELMDLVRKIVGNHV